MKRVYGSYLSSIYAARAIEDLLSKGYTRDQIKVISIVNLEKDLNSENEIERKDNRNLWEKIKDAFSFEKYDDHEYFNYNLDKEDRDLLKEYRNNLKEGETVILIEDSHTLETPVADWDEREREFYDVSDDS